LYGGDELAAHGRTMGQLSASLGVRQNALTQAADRLIHNGLAERIGDEHDRRIVRLRLSQKGREWVSERRNRRRDSLDRMWRAMTVAEREEFVAAIHLLDRATRRLADEDIAA